MNTLIAVCLFIFILILGIRKPIVAIVLLINIYLIKAIPYIDWYDPSYTAEDLLGNDIVFGAILPLLVIFLIIGKIFFSKFHKLVYKLDVFDFLLGALTIILLVYIFVSPDFYFSLDYFLRFIFIGLSYYFVVKLVLFNVKDPVKALKESLLTFYFFGIIISLTAYLIILLNKVIILRLTLPGIHAIPFSQAIGMSFIISFVIFITKGRVLDIKSSKFLFFNNFILFYLMVSLFATNTRGILLSSFLSILFFLIFKTIRITFLRKMLLFSSMIPVLLFLLYYIDTSHIFRDLSQDQSTAERFIAFNQCISIFYDNIFGVGTGAFHFHSTLPYPHNLFLENLVNYGIIGIFWNIFFVFVIGYGLYICLKIRRKYYYSILIFTMFLFYFIETMFSFTLWMQKGMFFSLGVLSYILYMKDYKMNSDQNKFNN
jgi:O-antigen ligase